MIMKSDKKFKEIKTPAVRWLHFNKPKSADLDYLRNNFKFHPLDLEDCLSPTQRSKLDEYPEYLFMILTFPYYFRPEKEIRGSEVDFFIGPDYLISVSDGNLPPLNHFFEQCQLNEAFREKYLGEGPTQLLYALVNKLQHYCYPMLTHIDEDIESIEKIIFSGYEKKMVKKILEVKRNIVSFRRNLQAHKNVIHKLMSKKDKFFIPNAIGAYFANILEQTKDLWDILENLKEDIEALHSTNESLISFRLNDIMKILMIISVILLPINMLASIFGMNTPIMPIVNHPDGFWIILGIMAVLIVGAVMIIKKKKWM